MGNVLKKEKDPLEEAKRKAAKRRATKLKQKRRSTMHTREWDPSGDVGNGPTIGIGGQFGSTVDGADEVGGSSQADSGWKVSRDKRASLKPTKEWDPSGDTDQTEERYKQTSMHPGESWKAALDLADVGAKEKLRRRSKRPSMRASMTKEHRQSKSVALETLEESVAAEGSDGGGGMGAAKSVHHRPSASAPVLPPPSTAPPATGSYTNTARLSLVKMKRASATNAGAGARAGAGAGAGAGASAASSGSTVRDALAVVAERDSEQSSSSGGSGAGSGAGAGSEGKADGDRSTAMV